MCQYPAECAEVGVGVGHKPTDFMSGRFVTYDSHEDNTNEVACFGQYIIHSMERMNSPCGMDSVGHVIPSFHKHKRSETIGHKKCCISLGFCSFGPGRILVHIRFDMQYLENLTARHAEILNVTYQYPGGRLQIKKDVGHDECDGAMLLHM